MSDNKQSENKAPSAPPSVTENSNAGFNVVSGAKKYADGEMHNGVAIQVASYGELSTLMIPDVEDVESGGPVYITRPIRIKGVKLKEFLDKKDISLPNNILNLIGDAEISCEAFYYTNTGPLLMMFALSLKEGLIKSLTGDDDIGSLFDVKGATVRILRSPQSSFSELEKYAAELAS